MTSRTDPVAVPVHASAAARRDRLMGLLCALVVVALFSGFTLVSRLGFSSALKLPDVAALRFGIGGLLLLPVLLNKRLGAVTWPQAAVLAFFGGLGFALFAYGGFLLAPASHGAVLLHGTLPLFTFVAVRLSPLFLKSPPAGGAPRFSPGLAMILAGIVAMSWDSWASATPRQLAGDGCLLLASISWSTYGVIVKRLKIAPAHAASIVAVLSMAVYLPVYFFLPGKALAAAAWHDILIQAVFQGVFLGVVSIFVYTRAVALLGAQETALFTAAVPCITTGLAVVLLGEIPTAAALVGVAIVTAGMVVAMRKT
ncbi:DMT family transporter [Ramlibacter sp.]|uniref:DMT family transporter n=1 Tax=Ramlibacter sp. TaxID=1917967 RepID=UPI001854E5B0|nr:DMT family transporter [Ramlibacter sp.]MBA2674977.1 DMT family transporter [Ramlibacter sp.]